MQDSNDQSVNRTNLAYGSDSWSSYQHVVLFRLNQLSEKADHMEERLNTISHELTKLTTKHTIQVALLASLPGIISLGIALFGLWS